VSLEVRAGHSDAHKGTLYLQATVGFFAVKQRTVTTMVTLF